LLLFQLVVGGNTEDASDDDVLRFIGLGDWGEILLRGQKWVASGMANYTRDNDPQFVVTTGDNIYPEGITSADDIQMTRKWYNVYHVYEELEPLPWYVSLGNHDYGQGNRIGQEWAMIDFGRVEPRWILPHLWYSFYKSAGDALVHFIVTDSEVITKEVNNYTQHMEWLEDELSNSEGDYVIVIGHRHMYSVGDTSATTSGLVTKLKPLLDKYEVDMYLAGHDHNQQHLKYFDREDNDIDYVVTGAGGALISRYIADNEDIVNGLGVESLYFTATYGFTGFEITEEAISWEFIRHDEEVLYSYSRPRKEKRRAWRN
jgi:3',5'-cyclic AMP phosphodiesterase CpdA